MESSEKSEKDIFSNETKVILGTDNQTKIWREGNEKYLPGCLGALPNPELQCKVSVMFWGYTYYDGAGTLVPVDANINSQKYVNSLEEA